MDEMTIFECLNYFNQIHVSVRKKNKRKQTRTVKKNNHPTKNNNIRIIKDLKKNIKELKLTNKNIIKHLEQTTAEFFT